MNEKIKLIVLIIVFVALLIWVNNMLNKSEIEENDFGNTEENISSENNINTEIISSSYENAVANNVEINNVEINETNTSEKVNAVIKVTEATFEKEVLNSEQKVLIDFYADWCNPCKILSPTVEEVAKENPNLKVVKINVDENENLAYKYRAFSIPTLVVIENGEEVNRAVGAIPKDDILDLVK